MDAVDYGRRSTTMENILFHM